MTHVHLVVVAVVLKSTDNADTANYGCDAARTPAIRVRVSVSDRVRVGLVIIADPIVHYEW